MTLCLRAARTTLVLLAVSSAAGPAPAQAPALPTDTRIVVTLPAGVAERFRAEMRGHMRSLDDVLFALTDADYAEAANVADVHWDFGHRMWEAFETQGLSTEEIAQRKAEMRAAMEAAGGPMGGGAGAQGGMMGGRMGFGRYMPEAFRALGQGFHEAGQRFAVAARTMSDATEAPDAAAQRSLLGRLQEVTGYCRACHETYRIVASPE
ncbi:cytochrome c [Roseospira marina]|uniref:Cytochrome c n=1 Tax=Roseospira marina TaxID=140057 RepID=A0A5M6IAT8_9PROT|nr:cytochrome c [Roseospira marina]KAA5604738.1 cytochrome c [Roseospira marina]MBB4313412.1 hypothetical protein [Roseospira marina]MBB5086574.1 hypothetical protein [Roseospira marina]